MPGSWLAALDSQTGRTYLAAVALALVLLALTRRLGVLFFLAAFPATLAHELMHLAVGLLTHGQPSGLRLRPQRSARGYVLGSVTCNNVRWYNGLFIGLAPLLLLPAALTLLRWRAPQPLVAAELAWVYLIACLVYASLPSWQDLRVALASSWLLVALLAGVALAVGGGW
jgi:hypothetical protein